MYFPTVRGDTGIPSLTRRNHQGLDNELICPPHHPFQAVLVDDAITRQVLPQEA